jgi:hypothetical protein
MPGAWEAASDVASLAAQALGVDEAQLGVAFYPAQMCHPDFLEGLRLSLGNIPIVGCSARLSFASPDSPGENVAFMLFSMENIDVRHRLFDCDDGEGLTQWLSDATGEAPEGRQHLFLFLGSGRPDESAVCLDEIRDHFGQVLPVLGAFSSGDADGNESVCASGHRPSRGIAALYLSGRFRWGIDSAHGWTPASRAWEITEAHGNMLEALDGVPASKLYETYFQKTSEELCSAVGERKRIFSLYPLGLEAGGEASVLPVRSLASGGALILDCPAPRKGLVRLMFNSRENLTRTAAEVTARAIEYLDGAPVRALIVFSDLARAALLGHDLGREMEAIRGVAGENVPLIGFFSSAQVSPEISGRDFNVTQQAWKRPRLASFCVRRHSITILALAE